jgi:trk system potassium uptake protein TrkA
MPELYVIIAGAGKVGWNLARELIEKGHEVTCIEQDRRRYLTVEQELEHAVQYGDSTELWVLERAGIQRADLVVAVTGDDEDNLIICQLAREKYGAQKVVARVNDPRNQVHFDLLGISATVSATAQIMGLIEHEVPEHGLIQLLELRRENLEIVEVQIEKNAPAAGKTVEKLKLPEGSRLISITRNGRSEIAIGSTQLQPGDQVLAILQPGKEDELRRVLLTN